MHRRPSASFAFLVALACALSSAGAQVRPAAAAPRPTLVVFVTVDQMRSDYFQRFDRQLTGGLRRLFDGGAFFPDAYQDHAITETAPGHASTMSGRFPVHTGIVMNSQGVNGVPDASLIGALPNEPGASPLRFQGTTLTDWIKAAHPHMRFLSVSRKDRGAILPIGRSKGDVYWWSASGTFTTSRYYADSLPGWVQRFNARRMAQSYAGKEWTLLLPASAYPEADSVPVESGGTDYVFPHEVPADSGLAARVAAGFPWMDEITLAFALDGLRELGLGAATNQTDVLAVSLSTTDAIGHRYGPDSRELHDHVLRLDRALGVFFDSLFKLRDREHVVIALTGDHGMAPFPTLKSEIYPNHDAKQVSLAAPWSAFLARLTAAGVDRDAVAMEEAGVIVEKPESFAKANVNADSAIASFGADVKRVDGVLRADLITTLAKADTVHDAIARRWLHMFRPDGPVRLVVTLTPYSYWSGVTIATHGSPHDYDAKVPVVFYGARVKPGRYSGFVRVVDMAPTLAEIVGVKPLEPLDGHVLRQAIR
jgi:hypothetical protein